MASIRSKVEHGMAANAAIPCSTDFHSIRTELDLQAIKDPGLQREVGEFQLACFGHARNELFQQGGRIEASLARDVDWVGSRYFFLETPGFYDSFYAGRPIPGFPYDAERDSTTRSILASGMTSAVSLLAVRRRST
ncbi:hypothetical protein [Litchfieldella anticariensis]|nr:hypothetical protein [Halomonas anticariensis]